MFHLASTETQASGLPPDLCESAVRGVQDGEGSEQFGKGAPSI